MSETKDVRGILKLEQLLFDKLEFRRIGFKTVSRLEMDIQVEIYQRDDAIGEYKTTLIFTGTKAGEYELAISLSGYFHLEENSGLSKEDVNALISRNSVSIMLPYLRSEVSILTAQPGVDCVVLPTFNVNKLLDLE